MYGQHILCGISKGTFEIPHKISYPYIERCGFYSQVKIEELLDLRAQDLISVFETPPRSSAQPFDLHNGISYTGEMTSLYWIRPQGVLHDFWYAGLAKGPHTCAYEYWSNPSKFGGILANNSLHWRHNERDDVSSDQHHDCLLSRLFMCRSKETSKLCVTGFCVGNSLVTSEFLAERASNANKVSIWWRHVIGLKSPVYYITGSPSPPSTEWAT